MWNSSTVMQSFHRALRKGQRRHVQIIIPLIDNSFDIYIYLKYIIGLNISTVIFEEFKYIPLPSFISKFGSLKFIKSLQYSLSTIVIQSNFNQNLMFLEHFDFYNTKEINTFPLNVIVNDDNYCLKNLIKRSEIQNVIAEVCDIGESDFKLSFYSVSICKEEIDRILKQFYFYYRENIDSECIKLFLQTIIYNLDDDKSIMILSSIYDSIFLKMNNFKTDLDKIRHNPIFSITSSFIYLPSFLFITKRIIYLLFSNDTDEDRKSFIMKLLKKNVFEIAYSNKKILEKYDIYNIFSSVHHLDDLDVKQGTKFSIVSSPQYRKKIKNITLEFLEWKTNSIQYFQSTLSLLPSSLTFSNLVETKKKVITQPIIENTNINIIEIENNNIDNDKIFKKVSKFGWWKCYQNFFEILNTTNSNIELIGDQLNISFHNETLFCEGEKIKFKLDNFSNQNVRYGKECIVFLFEQIVLKIYVPNLQTIFNIQRVRNLISPNLPKTYKIGISPSFGVVVTERVFGLSFNQFIFSIKTLTKNEMIKHITQLSKNLDKFEEVLFDSKHLFLRDISNDNIIINNNNDVVIIDGGCLSIKNNSYSSILFSDAILSLSESEILSEDVIPTEVSKKKLKSMCKCGEGLNWTKSLECNTRLTSHTMHELRTIKELNCKKCVSQISQNPFSFFSNLKEVTTVKRKSRETKLYVFK